MTNENQALEINATLTCPICNTKQKVIMPVDQLQHYYKCINQHCLADLSPIEGKDCVFCSYADKPCPPKQLNPESPHSGLRSLI